MAAEMGPHISTRWTSPSCSMPPAHTFWSSFQFLLFGLCPQRIAVSTVHIVFLGIVILLGVVKIQGVKQPKLNTFNAAHVGKKGKKHSHVGILFTITYAVVLCVAIGYTAVAVWRVGYGLHNGWKEIQVEDVVLSITQTLAWIIWVLIVRHQKQFTSSSIKYSAVVRAWWVVNFCFTVLALWSTISRFLHHDPRSLQLWVDDIVILATTPAVVYLMVVALAGVTGITVEEESDSAEPFLAEAP